MGSAFYTYVISTGAILTGAVGAAVAGMDKRTEGMILMALGGTVFLIGGTVFCLHALNSDARRRRPVTDPGRARVWAKLAER